MTDRWAKIVEDVVSLAPAIIALILITGQWDGEWLVVAALALSAAGRRALRKFNLTE